MKVTGFGAWGRAVKVIGFRSRLAHACTARHRTRDVNVHVKQQKIQQSKTCHERLHRGDEKRERELWPNHRLRGLSSAAMAESLVAVRLLSSTHQEPWEEHEREYKKVHGERIKQGNFGQVWRARHTDPDGSKKSIVVIKEVTHTPGAGWQEAHELECLRRVNDHRFRDHVIKLLRVFHKVSSHVVANIIVMESGVNTLMDIQRSHSGYGTRTVQAWMRSLARAVWACHEVQVMHRDIKPANCIMCLGQEGSLDLKLADFGNSAVVSAGPPVPGASHALTWATTPSYCAPELFSGFHTFSGDVWSIGVICSELLHTEPG